MEQTPPAPVPRSTREPVKSRLRSLGTALGLLVCLGIVAWTVVLVRADRRQKKMVENAVATVKDLGSMQESFHRIHGRYTGNVFLLAQMTSDWKTFMDALDVMLDLRGGFRMEADGTHYRIEARARDRKRSLVVYVGGTPPKTPPRMASSAVK